MNFELPFFIESSARTKAAIDTEPLKSTLKSYRTQAGKTSDAKLSGYAQAPLLKGAGDKTANLLMSYLGPLSDQTYKCDKELRFRSHSSDVCPLS